MKIVICTLKSWNIEQAQRFIEENRTAYEVYLIEQKEDLTAAYMKQLSPDYILFPHWSYIIPADIYQNYCCIVFHMTDLPFGRGGSPLQNLIVRGVKRTKISAIRVAEGLDTGDVYCKADLTLEGTAGQILTRATHIIYEQLIPRILQEDLVPQKQIGEVVTFKRRKPEQSILKQDMTIEQLYDHIRMLDGEGYPPAYLEFGDKRLTFTEACFQDGTLTAQVKFTEHKDIQ